MQSMNEIGRDISPDLSAAPCGEAVDQQSMSVALGPDRGVNYALVRSALGRLAEVARLTMHEPGSGMASDRLDGLHNADPKN